MNDERQLIDVLQNTRHDWLNKLQLIKGNLALERPERVKEIIDEIVIEARQETQLSNLGVPKFAAKLLTFSWSQHAFTIEYDIMGAGILPEQVDGALSAWFAKLFETIDETVDKSVENHLSVTIDLTDEEQIQFLFDLRGKFADDATFEKLVHTDCSAFTKVQHETQEEWTFSFSISRTI
ncbi:Spo0B C-terminal domain-containing protein [Bacillus fonticola]|uniref:Spo0B C-terminal domain-containing protein n=1 Tax=Bacillus fonticola TaxID=2728853 RepID=UPI00147398A4|nr:Spo0B C-terminal domain-containing protein [Bacillus fonticola]